MSTESATHETAVTWQATDPSAGRGWQTAIDLALAEDIGSGDITTLATVSADLVGHGEILAKSAGIISGLGAVAYAFQRVDPAIRLAPRLADGDPIAPGTVIATVDGPARGILTAERVALNLLQRLSGVATTTARYVEIVADLPVRIIDTRKTTPGLRLLEKAAVRHGGGHNHRVGLADGILIKDNHLAAVGGADRVGAAIRLARASAPHTLQIEVEVTTLAEVDEALRAGADAVLLDNMDAPTMREAVRQIGGRALTEASGGITLETVRVVAETGVDLISVGALTHSAPALDISLELALSSEDGDSSKPREP